MPANADRVPIAQISIFETVHRNTEAYLASPSESDLTGVIETPLGEAITLNKIIWHVLEREVHHRGELSLILGMLGNEGPDA